MKAISVISSMRFLRNQEFFKIFKEKVFIIWIDSGKYLKLKHYTYDNFAILSKIKLKYLSWSINNVFY